MTTAEAGHDRRSLPRSWSFVGSAASNWDQLGSLFGVDRRVVLYRVSGQPLGESEEKRVRDLLAVVREIDRGNAVENRTFLLEKSADGRRPFDLLLSEELGEVVDLGKPGACPRREVPRVRRSSPSRVPLRPEILAGALQDGAYISKERIISATPISKKLWRRDK